MSDDIFIDVKEALGYLTTAQLKNIIADCNIRISKNEKIKESEFYTIVCQVMALKLGVPSQPLPFIKKNNKPLYEKIIQTETDLDNFLTLHFSKVTRINKLLFYSLVCEVVMHKLETTNAPITLQVFINFFKDFQVYFNRAFPGYAEAGLLPFLLASRQVK